MLHDVRNALSDVTWYITYIGKRNVYTNVYSRIDPIIIIKQKLIFLEQITQTFIGLRFDLQNPFFFCLALNKSYNTVNRKCMPLI